MRKIGLLIVAATSLSACNSTIFDAKPAKSQGEAYSGFGYVPMDPLTVNSVAGTGCKNNQISGELLNALPDNAVRIAINQISASGDATIVGSTVGTKNSSYEVVLDYINADVTNIRFKYKIKDGTQKGAEESRITERGQIESITRLDKESTVTLSDDEGAFVVPVYVGVGMRLTAQVTVLKGEVNLSSLGALAAAAEAERISGSMIVQTLGITGPQVTTALPLPNELNATTIQNAILSMGSIKAMVNSEAVTTARVTGIYNPLGTRDQRIISMIVSELASKPVEWKRACVAGTQSTT